MSHIGHYELISDLGSGAMGKVYRARDTRLDREVALKVLWPQLAELPAAVARFEREARAVARLRHPNVVAVFDVGAADGYHYLAMECVAGPSLRELLKQPLPIVKALHYFKQILSGLGVAHEQGVIHRDLKPGNILIEAATNTVKLADFGLARIIEEEASLTQSGEMLGTIEYMAPELGRGEGASRQSDLYAAGVVLYRLLAGRFPFQGATPVAILKAHKCGTYPLVTTMVKGLPPQADAVIARLLACEPANRYADCQAVFADLERWEKGEAIPLEFAATYEPIDHELERHRVPGWKRIWTRVATWYRYQWLEAFDRTELTAIRIRDEVQTAETELGQARRRLEEATLLRNRVRSRADEARAAMQASEQAAEQAYVAADEPLMRQHLAAKLEAKERAEELEKEAAQSEQVVTLARQENESKATMIAELRHGADLLLARRRRAKLELSVLGILPVDRRRLGERWLATVKIFGPMLMMVIALYYLAHYLAQPSRVPVSKPSQQIQPTIIPPPVVPRIDEIAWQSPVPPNPNSKGDEATSGYFRVLWTRQVKVTRNPAIAGDSVGWSDLKQMTTIRISDGTIVSSPITSNTILIPTSSGEWYYCETPMYDDIVSPHDRRWKFAIPDRPDHDEHHQIATGGPNLYVTTVHGCLYALDQGNGGLRWTTGNDRWHHPMRPNYYSYSDILADNSIVYYWDGILHALRAGSGLPVWQFTVPDLPVRTYGKIFMANELIALSMDTIEKMLIFNRTTGQPIYQLSLVRGNERRTPMLLDDKSVLFQEYGGDRRASVLVELPTGYERWRFPQSDSFSGRVVRDRNRLFLCNSYDAIVALDMITGQVVGKIDCGMLRAYFPEQEPSQKLPQNGPPLIELIGMAQKTLLVNCQEGIIALEVMDQL